MPSFFSQMTGACGGAHPSSLVARALVGDDGLAVWPLPPLQSPTTRQMTDPINPPCLPSPPDPCAKAQADGPKKIKKDAVGRRSSSSRAAAHHHKHCLVLRRIRTNATTSTTTTSSSSSSRRRAAAAARRARAACRGGAVRGYAAAPAAGRGLPRRGLPPRAHPPRCGPMHVALN